MQDSATERAVDLVILETDSAIEAEFTIRPLESLIASVEDERSDPHQVFTSGHASHLSPAGSDAGDSDSKSSLIALRV